VFFAKKIEDKKEDMRKNIKNKRIFTCPSTFYK
jgi:hypothetical protein